MPNQSGWFASRSFAARSEHLLRQIVVATGPTLHSSCKLAGTNAHAHPQHDIPVMSGRSAEVDGLQDIAWRSALLSGGKIICSNVYPNARTLNMK